MALRAAYTDSPSSEFQIHAAESGLAKETIVKLFRISVTGGMFRLARVIAAVAATAIALAAAPAEAQGYPSRPVHVIVPFAPGGAADAIARQMSQLLSERLGQPFVIENKPGADSSLGAAYVAKSAPDGYTLLFTTDATFVLNPLLFTTLPYDAARDFVPVATVAYLNLALTVSAELPVNTFAELVDYTKSHPGKLSYGSPGVGSQAQLMGEMYKKLTGTDIVHVPYKGAGPALTDLLGGRILFTFPSIPTIQGFLKDKRLKVLAISGDARSPLLPDVPTFAEVGFKEMDIGAWYAFLAPAATPANVVAQINSAVNAILSEPDVQKDFVSRGMLAMKQSSEQFANYARSERARMSGIVKASGAKVE
jgi:tripartite-type tricarboxylate transporter receptor subunit TctC